MKTDISYWVLGQLMAAAVGLLVAFEYTASIGLAVCYGLMLLVDIRHRDKE